MKYLFDVRTEEEFNAGHAKEAINVPLGDLIEPTEKVDLMLKEILKDDVIQVYCQSGGRAEVAKDTILSFGFKNVTNLGGIQNI